MFLLQGEVLIVNPETGDEMVKQYISDDIREKITGHMFRNYYHHGVVMYG